MKTFSMFALATTVWANAQAPYDTSILRDGNVWVYQATAKKQKVLMPPDDQYEVIRTYRIDSLRAEGDSVRFRVTQRDSGFIWGYTFSDTAWMEGAPVVVATWSPIPHDDTVIVRYVFKNNAFQPEVPFFFVNQAFADEAPRAIYNGDTVKWNRETQGPCWIKTTENIMRVGRTLDYSTVFCGMTRDSHDIKLLTFNGTAYLTPVPVALAAKAARTPMQAAWGASWNGRGAVSFGGDTEAYDVRGQRAPRRIEGPKR